VYLTAWGLDIVPVLSSSLLDQHARTALGPHCPAGLGLFSRILCKLANICGWLCFAVSDKTML